MGCCDGNLASTIAHGAEGVARAVGHALGVNAVPLKVLMERARECRGDGRGKPACPHTGVGLFCGKCGCFISAKIRNRGESCPDGRWAALPDDDRDGGAR